MRLSWMNITIPIVSSPNKNMIEYSFEGFEPMKEEVTFYYGSMSADILILQHCVMFFDVNLTTGLGF